MVDFLTIPEMEQSLRPSPVTTSSITNTTTGEIYTVSHEVLFADTFINGGDGGGQGDQGSTPSLTEAILETDSFLVRAYTHYGL